jgi:hypothetical protein
VSAVEAMDNDVPEGLNSADLEAIVRSVQAQVRDVSRWEIERVVLRELARFQDARVTLYLPILVERAAVQRVRGFSLAARHGS